MTHRFHYAPGITSVVIVGDWAVLVGVPPSHAIVAKLYRTLSDRPSMDGVKDLLAAAYGEVTDVVVLHAAEPAHLFLWGDVGVESMSGERRTGGSLGTEHRLSGVVGAWVGAAIRPQSMLPAGQGVFLAGRVETAPLEGRAPGSVVTSVPAFVAGTPSAPWPTEPPLSGANVPAAGSFSSASAPPAVPSSASSAVPFFSVGPGGMGSASTSYDAPYVPVAPPPMAPGERPRQLDLDYTLRPRTALARRCPQGHVSAAFLEACPTCGALLGGSPTEIPQPSLGRLVISTGGEIVLDHDALVGRNPTVPPDFPGEAPELVRVKDPTNDVSNRHLQIRVGQWQVIVRDLGSTNGTDVVRPGWAPMSLGPGQETAIEPGTRVILAGKVTLTFTQP